MVWYGITSLCNENDKIKEMRATTLNLTYTLYFPKVTRRKYTMDPWIYFFMKTNE